MLLSRGKGGHQSWKSLKNLIVRKDSLDILYNTQGFENVWNHHYIILVVEGKTLRFSTLVYYSFTYLLVPDVIFLHLYGAVPEDAVKGFCRIL